MIDVQKGLAILILAACNFTPVRSPTTSDLGVVVESVTGRALATTAGIRVGDIFSFSLCGKTRSSISSPFDFSTFRLQQDTCASAIWIQGSRHGEQRIWKLDPGDWRLEVRPVFTGTCLGLYRDGQDLASKGHLAEASERWRGVAARACGSTLWLPTWVALHTAQLFAESQRWDAADREYRNALGAARTARIAAQVLAEWAETFLSRNDWANAEECFRRALMHAEESGRTDLFIATYLGGLSTVYLNRGDLATAAEYSRRELAITERLAPDSLRLAATLTNNGSIAWRRGDLVSAEQYFRKDLDICERRGHDTLDLAASLNNLGSLMLERGDPSAADNYYRRALAIAETVDPDGPKVAICLHNLGVVALHRGDFGASAKHFRRSLSIKEKVAPSSLSAANSLNTLGKLEKKRHNPAGAKRYLDQAAAIQRRLAPRSLALADTLNSIGDIYYDERNIIRAGKYYQDALEIREILAPGSRAHAETLASLARTMLRKGRLPEAGRFYEKALDALENQTARLGGGEQVQSIFRARFSKYYEDFVDFLVAQKMVGGAFEVSERSRAQTLLGMLAAARIDIRKGVEPRLLERQHVLQRLIASKSEERLRLLSTTNATDRIAQVNMELSGAVEQSEQLQSEIRVSSPGYAALTTPRPLSLTQIQHEFLGDDAVLLEYMLGDERSYVWAVNSNSISVHELPKREVIERVARRLYGFVKAPGVVLSSETKVEKQARLSKAESEWSVAAVELAGMILGPVARHLNRKRLLIVSDGALQYIPFGILPTPGIVQGENGGAVPFAAVYELVNLPSISVLAALRRDESLRKRPPKAVAVLADPVFDEDDERVRNTAPQIRNVGVRTRSFVTSGQPPPPIREVTRHDVEQMRLPRLLFTRQEAEMILAAVPVGQKSAAFDFKANRAAATSDDLAQYRIVHFATHGLLDSSHPALSGLIFSLVDESGKPQRGFVGLDDIYNLNLPVDLVVLSACETGLGEEIRREGLVGLTRGFMYAGASRVVASLWIVDDLATAELMAKFYKGMERDRLRPAAALRAAQMELREQKRWHSPYYWAAFQIHGEWR